MGIEKWMSWDGGVDLVGLSRPGLAMPNVIVHVARMVQTPVGSSPGGLVLFQPDPAEAPRVMGFICHDPQTVGKYFGPNIFAGTPFEQAPVLGAKIEIWSKLPGSVGARVSVGDLVLETELSALSPLQVIHRTPAAMSPFWQQGVEAAAGKATLKVNGADVPVILPPVGITGGAAAVWSPAGIYAR